MNEEKVVTTNKGVGIFTLLGLLFVGLKLGGVIAWSWWWVTAPFWGGIALCVGVMVLYALIVAISCAIAAIIQYIAFKLRK